MKALAAGDGSRDEAFPTLVWKLLMHPSARLQTVIVAVELKRAQASCRSRKLVMRRYISPGGFFTYIIVNEISFSLLETLELNRPP